ncbi:MAG: trpD, partial [Rhodocyclales bacterium]|nr:trpD [Rhodocyclales bacterium]
PEDVGLPMHGASTLKVASIEESRGMLLAALDGSNAAARDIVAFNAGATLYVSGVASNLKAGVARALTAIADGTARAKLDAFVARTQAVS